MPRRTMRISGIRFRYEYPQVSIDVSTRTKVHEPIGETPVVQYLGPGKKQISIRGHCYLDTAQEIQRFTVEEKLDVRTEEFNGTAVLNDASVEPENAKGGIPPGKSQPTNPDRDHKANDWRYEYELELTEVRDT